MIHKIFGLFFLTMPIGLFLYAIIMSILKPLSSFGDYALVFFAIIFASIFFCPIGYHILKDDIEDYYS